MIGDYMAKKVKKIKPTVQPEVTPLLHSADLLLETLFFFWDGFERASMNFFLVKDTARQVMGDVDLHGEQLTLGIRKLEWIGGQDRVFLAFIEHEKVPINKLTDTCYHFRYKEVPVLLYIYDENPCVTNLDIVFYKNDTFNIPNPFNLFCDKYDY